ncbi:MAG TPA: hypothetical protein ACFYEK_02405 [Candidatus Wunengus sp. YC60]|uniref:hypothetical protein n=1 Tax=Candidatus Wunengus sp. YC60 TaxID=3367697 RepID=UPI0040258616
MRAIKGIFDGENFIALENFPKKKKYKVVITFIEEIDTDEEIRSFSAQTKALSFWENEGEDLYQEYLVKR